MGKTKITVINEGADSSEQETKKESASRQKKRSQREEKGVHIPGLKGGERVVVVGGETPVEEETEASQPEKEEKKAKEPKHVGKKYLAARAKVDPAKTYTPSEAATLVQKTSFSAFPGSVELHLVVGKEGINTQTELPHSTGTKKKIEIADEKTVEKLKKGKIDFDVLLASPAMMPKLVPFAKTLGPRGLMPNPKQGTITENPEQAKKKFGGNSISLKTQKDAPLIHTTIGKTNQPGREISENIKAVIEAIGSKKVKKAVISASMGPGIKIAVA
ncbi:hypothetical protein CMO96_03060 [Candidatus Woesebacteria bacterium]|nr:hypothetical protein [Candidatus Woesebacteria bacterium]|tara:strand:- start:240 stop:1061 length:822 start_codon:yes stop_codon:yes gene_type:complete